MFVIVTVIAWRIPIASVATMVATRIIVIEMVIISIEMVVSRIFMAMVGSMVIVGSMVMGVIAWEIIGERQV